MPKVAPGLPELITLEEYGFQTNRTAVPKGTADIVMGRLFPKRQSEVPTDEERRQAVYMILKQAGVFDEERNWVHG